MAAVDPLARFAPLAALVAVLVCVQPATASHALPFYPQEDTRESEPDPEIQTAAHLIRTGAAEKAARVLTSLLKDEPKNRAALALRAQAHAAVAAWDAALEDAKVLLDADSTHGPMHLLVATVLSRRGAIEEALEHGRRAMDTKARGAAHALRARIFDSIGDRSQALAEAREAARLGTPNTPREWLARGEAEERLGAFEEASEAYVKASSGEAPDDDPLVAQDALVALGNLYNRVYRQTAGRPNGEREFKDVLKENADHLGALLGRYRIGIANHNLSSDKTEECFRRLLEIDPRNPEVLLLQLSQWVDNRRFEDARTLAESLLAENPRLRRARAEAVALDYLQHRLDAHGRSAAEDLAAHPGDSLFPRVLGEHLKSLYRFADAVPFLEEAAKRDARDAEARTALGECLAHLGREKEAKARFEEAESLEEGFVHPWRRNMIEVLTALEKEYVTVASPNFEFKLHPKCEPVLRETLTSFYEGTRRDYGERYGYQPAGKTLIEVFHRFDYFSVRSVGFEGFGALGVCFGPVITAVSPLAVPFRGNFSYLDTAWHEYAHVVHLALSKGRVPRWYTEGLATLEEVKRNPAFDRRMELDLLEARATDTIFPILELNGAFRGPRILFGYYQGGLLCEYLEKRTSPERLVEALTLFGKDLPLEEVIQKAFAMTVEELDRGFLGFVDEKLKRVRVRPGLDERTIGRLRRAVAKNPSDAESLRSLAWAHARAGRVADAEAVLEKLRTAAPNDPEGLLVRGELSLLRKRPDLARMQFAEGFAKGGEEFFARLKFASVLEQERDFEGVKTQLRAAIVAFPTFADARQSPHVRLARMLEAEEKTDECAALLEEFGKISGSALEPRMRLADLYERKGDVAGVARVLGEVLDVDPFQRAVQLRRAEALLTLQRFEEAAHHAMLARLVDPSVEPARPGGARPPSASEEASSKAACAALEAEAWIRAKKLDRARAALVQALRFDATNERALRQKEALESLERR